MLVITVDEKIQNLRLRLCSEALQSPPINCLQHHCNEMPVKIKFEQLCLYYRAHLCTFTSDLNHRTSAVIKDSWKERFPDNPNFTSFNVMTKHFFESSQIQINKIVISDIPP